jgi:hypothetical protein
LSGESNRPAHSSGDWPVVAGDASHHDPVATSYAVTTYRSGPPLASASNG